MVVKFLQGQSKVKAEEIVDLVYNHPEAVPKTARSNASRARQCCPLPRQRANGLMEDWEMGCQSCGKNHQQGSQGDGKQRGRPPFIKGAGQLAVCSPILLQKGYGHG